MKGFLIFENTNGGLIYSKNYNQHPFTTNSSQDTTASGYGPEKLVAKIGKPNKFKNSVIDIGSLQEKGIHMMSSSLPPIS